MLTLTDRAVSVLKTVCAGTGLRIGVVTGGCAGLQYRMALDGEAGAEDEVLDLSGIRILVDRPSILWLTGVTIDFVEGGGEEGGGFVFDNPNAAGKCACAGGCG